MPADGHPAWHGPIDRRDFIRLAGLTGAAGAAAVTVPAAFSRGAVASAATASPGVGRAPLTRSAGTPWR